MIHNITSPGFGLYVIKSKLSIYTLFPVWCDLPPTPTPHPQSFCQGAFGLFAFFSNPYKAMSIATAVPSCPGVGGWVRSDNHLAWAGKLLLPAPMTVYTSDGLFHPLVSPLGLPHTLPSVAGLKPPSRMEFYCPRGW